MFDALKLLGSLAENRSAPSAANRFGAAMQSGSGGGLLQQVLAQFGGGGAQGGPNTAPGGSFVPSQAQGGQAQGGLGGM